jgi:signal transduction histidine kinase
MSTAILKFQQPEDTNSAISASTLIAAADICPEPLAIAEEGKLIYKNGRFTELTNTIEAESGTLPAANSSLQRTDFSVAGRNFTLLTRLRPPTSEWQRLALIGRLVGGVAHDFNNLLTGILLYCDLMQSKLPPSNPLAAKIDEIRVAAEQGAGLIRQLMSVGREEKDAPKWVAFSAALREMAPLVRHLVGENVHVTMELGDDAGAVGISLAQAQQIVLNLVLNARDAMPDGGNVVISTVSRQFEGTGPGDRIFELTVKDHGTGMDPLTAARIFEPFFTTKAPGRGTGMGLTTVRKIVDDAGGIVSVETARGKGTLISVRLPEIPAHELPATASTSEFQSTSSNPKRGAFS